ncbi:aspartate aminotransferase [[Phormidium ambiguum] IAM M-71]|uniref:Aspartate aminotransferase n=1 Tax=[Phormidium ambiguum] IAM M-71 TaxID=454136 RepID=A0A1U7IIT1_9CYAN|nr:pyridoxal phosphate-dependent aminotransferase [Phormidium ambiguum]OKH37020.1 aspartate aminotransferase [Phormidium ambiguum IAM M-71]
MKNEIQRMQAVQSPIIPVVGELIRSTPGTISLGQGVVYYGPPPEAVEQISRFLAEPQNHKYQAVEGISPLLEIISTKLAAENQIQINQNNCIVVTAGSNMGFMNAILAIANPGDEIILQTPYYFNHEMAIAMASCRPVLVNTDENYQLLPDAIASAITHKTKAVVTISPNNPTGAVYPQETLKAVNEICRQRGIYHISDEAYEYFTYNGVKHFSPAAIPHSNDYTISLFSLSKAYGFASWRIGYMVIPQHLLVSIKKIQDTILICAPVISQYAALGALQAGVNYCKEKIKAITKVREIVLQELQSISELCIIPPSDGAFYFLLKIQTNLGALELVEHLIREYKVAVIPGTTFGMDNGCYLRVAYGALQAETAQAGISRLVKGLKNIVS